MHIVFLSTVTLGKHGRKVEMKVIVSKMLSYITNFVFFLKRSCFLSTVILRKHGREVACMFKDESHNFKNVVLFYLNLIFYFCLRTV